MNLCRKKNLRQKFSFTTYPFADLLQEHKLQAAKILTKEQSSKLSAIYKIIVNRLSKYLNNRPLFYEINLNYFIENTVIIMFKIININKTDLPFSHIVFFDKKARTNKIKTERKEKISAICKQDKILAVCIFGNI